MKLSDLLTQEEKELPKQIAKQMMKLFSLGGRVPSFKEFIATESETLSEMATSDELKQLEQELRHLFGMEVRATKHFTERLTGRDANVPISAIIGLFQKLKAKYPVQIARAAEMGKVAGGVYVVVQDYTSNLNVAFIIGQNVTLKTVMSIHPDEFRSGRGSNRQLIFKV